MATALRIEAAVAGRRAAGTSEHSLVLDLPAGEPVALKTLIASTVRAEVEAFRQRAEEQRFVRVLTERALADGARQGAIRSGGGQERGVASGPAEVNVEEAIAAALLAHEDGLYKVILDGEPVDNLDDAVELSPESKLLFLRLVALAGG